MLLSNSVLSQFAPSPRYSFFRRVCLKETSTCHYCDKLSRLHSKGSFFLLIGNIWVGNSSSTSKAFGFPTAVDGYFGKCCFIYVMRETFLPNLLFSLSQSFCRICVSGMISNIPKGMVTDQFGMIGLLTFIRAAETEPNLVTLALGRSVLLSLASHIL